MTKRAVIITSSIILAIFTTITILFGVVFRVRNIDIVCSDEFLYQSQIDEIMATSKLKKNTSIFELNHKKIIDNIESAYPYARVEGVNLSSLTSVKIKLSNRVPTYYFVQEAVYYILDEDCKILHITNSAQQASGCIRIDNGFSASETTSVGQFISNKYSEICKNLYIALYTNATIETQNEQGEYVETYLNREIMCEIISNIEFSEEYILTGKTDSINISTKEGVKLNIIDPKNNLNTKINMAFSAFRALLKSDREQGTDLSKTGSINVIYDYVDDNVVVKCEYRK